MPKKIIRKDRFWVEKIEAVYGLNKSQLKILAKLASSIHKADVEFKEYCFDVRSTLSELGMGEENYDYLRKTTKDMASKVAEFFNDNGELVQTGIIVAKYSEDKSTLRLKIEPDLKPYFLQLRGWISKYELKYFISLKGKYSMRFYELMKTYQFMGHFEKSVKFLRKYFYVPKGKYEQMVHFRQRVIEDSIKDIEKNTEIEIEYRPIRNGRKIDRIEFWIFNKGSKERKEGQRSLFNGDKDMEREDLKAAEKELNDLKGKEAFYQHLLRTDVNDKRLEGVRGLEGILKRKIVLEDHIEELQKKLGKRLPKTSNEADKG
jgi:plasmid replication initiation protein